MNVFQCHCPGCQTLLRLREDIAGTQFGCPECGVRLELENLASGGYRAILAKPTVQPAKPAVREIPAPLNTAARPNRTPLWIAGGVAVVGLLFISVLIVLQPGADRHTLPKPQPETTTPTVVEKVTPGKPAVEVPLEPVAVPATPERRLQDLWTLLKSNLENGEQFPPGVVASPELPAEKSFSWLAQLQAQRQPDGPQPLWNHGWEDPRNDRFVRRRLEEWQNPAVPTLLGADGYPAGHFVGVSGVGADAAKLPVTAPRAGIFSEVRQTKASEIPDGLANTMLVAGVQENLGSWAAGGNATMRSFTRAPYVNGPDGFGTGQPDSMLVLMADGSVRTVSQKTDPAVIESLAAINDETQKQQQLAAKPEPTPPEPGLPMNDPEPAEEPILEAPVVPKVDVQLALQQQILEFEQRQPARLEELLVQVEGLAGVPIRFNRDELGEAGPLLDKTATLELKNVTVAEILRTLLDQTGLSYRLDPNGVQIIPTPPAEG